MAFTALKNQLEFNLRASSAEYAFNRVNGDIMTLKSCKYTLEDVNTHFDLVMDHFKTHGDMTPVINQTFADTIVFIMMHQLNLQSPNNETIHIREWIGVLNLILDYIILKLEGVDDELLSTNMIGEFAHAHFEKINKT